MTIDNSIATLARLIKGEGGHVRRVVKDAEMQATYYAWGRNDATRTSDVDAIEFALAYAIHVAEFKTAKRSARMSVQSAWESYAECGRILWYGHIDRVEPRLDV